MSGAFVSARERPTWVEVDHAALRHNLKQIQRHVGPDVSVIGVVKANAYGHGALDVAQTLVGAGVAKLAVATVAEGLDLRAGGIEAPIMVFAGRYDVAASEVWSARLEPVVFDHSVLDSLEAERPDAAPKLAVHLHLDSGMGRLGCSPADFPALLQRIGASEAFELVALMTHFACADASDDAHFRSQLEVFERQTQPLPQWDRHAANSAALAGHPGSHYDWVRPGLALYGVEPSQTSPLGLKPVMRWCTRIEHQRTLQAGESVGYGARWRAERESHVGILPVGYADGYPWSAEGRAVVLIHGQKVPVIGAVSMDLIAVDLTDTPGVEIGTQAVLVGRDGGAQITVEDMAAWSGRLVYEVMTSVGVRVPRRHLGSAP